MSDDELTLEQHELNKLLHESDENETNEGKAKNQTGKHVSNDHLIDFDPLNNEYNTKQNWYMAATFIMFFIFAAGVAMNVIAWNITRQNNNLLVTYQHAFKSLNASSWGLKCHAASSPDNPCTADGQSEDSLYNWQLGSNYHLGTSSIFPCESPTPYDSPCLEIEGKIMIFPNFSNPQRIDFADGSHLFSMASLVFPNTDTSANANVNSNPMPTWQQSNIRTLPGTRFMMNAQTNLNVEQNNLYGIQLPVVFWANNTDVGSSSTADYCQNPQIADLVDKYPLFMLFNPYLSPINGTVPTFSLCTCLLGPVQNVNPNPNLWNTMCVDASTFTLST